jgi:glutamate-1-semialdehyde 2,1-aminomutase
MTIWPDPQCSSHDLYERALKVFPGGVNRMPTWQSPFPIYAKTASGALITDVDGTQYIDFVNNFASLIHGHAHPEIVSAVVKQIACGTAFTMPTEAEVTLGELLCERGATFDKIRFSNSGTEAVMMALKAARAYTGRPKIAKIEGAYHGWYDYAEVSLDSTPENWGNEPKSIAYASGTPGSVTDDVVVIPFNNTASALQIIKAHADDIAAILIDLSPIYAGMVPAKKDFLDGIFSLAKTIGALVIADEVISFRLGMGGAQETFGVKPDLTVLGKIIGGGFPIGAVAGRSDVMAVFDHRAGKPLMPASGTFTANPVSMTAGLASMRRLSRSAFDELNELGAYARKQLGEAISSSRYPAQVTGLASMFKIHMHQRHIDDYRSAYHTATETKALHTLQERLLRHGVLISASGMGFISTVNSMAHVDTLSDAAERELSAMQTAL